MLAVITVGSVVVDPVVAPDMTGRGVSCAK